MEKFKGKDVLILGGGCGLAPLRSLFLTMLHDNKDYNSITFLAGAKTPKDCLYKDEVREWRKYDNVRFIRAVDEVPPGEQWAEDVCLVTKLLQKIDMKPDGNPAIVCGLPVMMKFGTFDLLKYGYKEENLYLSMEKKMYCGFGQCRHCVIGGYYACKDDFYNIGLAKVEEVYLRLFSRFDSGYAWPNDSQKKAVLNLTDGTSSLRRYQVYVYVNRDGQYAVDHSYIDTWQFFGLPLNIATPVSVRSDQWDKLKLYVRLNTPGIADGVVMLWINDVLKLSHSGLNLRQGTAYGIGKLIVGSYAQDSSGSNGVQVG